MHKLIINEELKNLLPPLSVEEFTGLEESILKDGCLSPLIEWNEILVDGHHRHEICTKHQIPFAVKSVVLDNLDDAKLWIWKHQENRRNLTPYHRAEIALKLKEAIAAKAKERQRASGGDRKSENAKSVPANLPEPIESKETREELAELAGMSPRSFAKAEFIAEHADEDTKEKLRRGVKGTSIDKEYNRLKAAEKKTQAKTAKPKRKTKIVSLRKGVKETQKYTCGVRFEPEPDDDYFDWITDEERAELREMQKTCPNRLVPMIRNYTIQSIPEHDPEYLLSCLFSLFQPLYRRKLLPALARKMFAQDDPDSVREIIKTLQTEFHQ